MNKQSIWSKRPITVKFQHPKFGGDFTVTYNGKSIEEVKRLMLKVRSDLGITSYTYSQWLGRVNEVQFIGVDEPLLRLEAPAEKVFTHVPTILEEQESLSPLSKEVFVARYIAHCEFESSVNEHPDADESQLIMADIAYQEYLKDEDQFLIDNPNFSPLSDHPLVGK